MNQRLVIFRLTKNGSTRHIPMSDQLWSFLHVRPRPLDASAPVLPVYEDPHSITRAFDRLARRLRLANLTFHDLRHDFASRLAMAGVPRLTISTLLGHKTVAMTMRYAHLSPQHLRDAIRGLDVASEPPALPVSVGTR